MGFDQSTISDVRQSQDGGDIKVWWTSSAPAGSVFQVYLACRLAWTGRARVCRVPAPATSGNYQVDVGVVTSGLGRSDLSAMLPPTLAANRAKVTWQGGWMLAPDLADFAIYRSPTAGAAIDFSTPVAVVPAYPGGVPVLTGPPLDYVWYSPPLGRGVWQFAAASRDSAGNRVAAPSHKTVVIATAPRPPAPNARGIRLTYTYDMPTRVVTLRWLASPG